MRNRVIHGYDKIDNEIIWGTLVRHLPTLKTEIDGLLNKNQLVTTLQISNGGVCGLLPGAVLII